MPTAEEPKNPKRRFEGFRADPRFRYPVLMIFYLMIGGALFNVALRELPGPIEALDRFTAHSVDVFMGLFTNRSTHRNAIVTLDGFSVSIIIECVGLLEMLIYSACVLAFPAPLRARLWGIPLGCAAIFVFNVLRIATLLVIGRHWNDYFDFFHLYFWQATLIAMIVGVLYGWIRFFVHGQPAAPSA